MRNYKKAVSFILVLTMLAAASVFSLQAFAADTENLLASGIETNEKDFIIAEKLAALGIVDVVSEDELANYMTRADIIGILIKYLNLSGVTVDADTTPFLDVSVYEPQISAYRALHQAGYISGDENKMYRPNDLLTYNEAVTLIVNAMGYKFFAVRNGGYPEGYLYTANKHGLLKGLRGNGNNPIPYCDLYRIIEASLDADAVVGHAYNADGVGEFVLQKGVTVLEETYKIKLIKGIVTGTEDTRLMSSGSELIAMDQIEINNVIYDAPGKIYAEYLGRNVLAYAKKNEQSEYEIIYIELADNQNNETQLDADVILPKSEQVSQDKLYYEGEGGKRKYLNLNSVATSVIYNGKYTGNALRNVLPESGYVVALDNNGDEVIDVLFIYEYKNIVVGAMDKQNYTIYDKNSEECFVFDPENDDVRIHAAGRYGSFDDIEMGSLLSVTETDNTTGYKLVNIYINSRRITGKVQEILNDEYYIGDAYYKLAPNVKKYVEDGDLLELKLGMNVIALLDKDGKIGHYEVDLTGGGDGDSLLYGFVAAIDTQASNINSSMALKIFAQDGTWVEAETAEKLNVDGYIHEIITATASDLAQVSAAIPVGEIVRFKMVDGRIAYIDTAARNKGNITAAQDYGNLNLIAYEQTGTYSTDAAGQIIWESTGGGFEQRFGVANKIDSASEKQFIVPSGKGLIFCTPNKLELLDDLEDSSRYSISKDFQKNYLRHSGDYTQPVIDGIYVYNLGEENINVATCVLLRGASATAMDEYSSPYSVVTKITSAVNKKGEKCKKIYYSSGGSEVGANISNELRVSYASAGTANASATETTFDALALEVGDVIQHTTDANREIIHINVVYRHDQQAGKNAYLKDNTTKLTFSSRSGEGVCARIEAVDIVNNILQYAIDTINNSGEVTETAYYNISLESAGISVYRHQYQEVSSASVADLLPGDKVLIRSSNGYAARAGQILVLR